MMSFSADRQSSVDPTAIHCDAFNAAFYELGLRWHWDVQTYQSLCPTTEEKERIRAYLESHQPHLLKAYDAEFLIEAIQTTKARCYESLSASSGKTSPAINWAELHSHEVGV